MACICSLTGGLHTCVDYERATVPTLGVDLLTNVFLRLGL